jgi:hypothetical protein
MRWLWLDFVKKYRSDHPNLSWKAALKAASGPYAKAKKDDARKGVSIPKERKPKKKKEDRTPNSCECFEEKVPMSKGVRKKVKHECGICETRKLTPKKKKPLRMKKKQKKRKAGSSSSKRQTVEPVKRKNKRTLDL